MENLNATASLSIGIDTGSADEQLNRLEARLAKLGVTGVGGVGNGSGEAAQKLKMLELEVEALTQKLDKQAAAKEHLSRVTRSWSATDGLSRVSFRENAQLSGEQVKNMVAQAEATKRLDGNTKQYVKSMQTAFEMGSRYNTVNSNRMKSLLETMTGTKPAIEQLNAYYKALEQGTGVYARLKQASTSWAQSSQEAITKAVSALTAKDTGLTSMGNYYRAQEQLQAEKDNGVARVALQRRNNQLLQADEKSHIATIAAMRAASARELAAQSVAATAASKAAAAEQQDMLAGMERMRSSWQALGRSQSAAIQSNAAMDLAKLNNQMGNVFNAARVSDAAEAYTTVGKRVLAARELVDQFGEAQARAFLGKNAFLVDQIARLDQYAKSAASAVTQTTNLSRAQNAAVTYASASPRQQAALNLKAGIALERGYDVSGYAAEAVAAAQAAGSVDALRAAKERLNPQTRTLTQGSRELAGAMQELHTGARGVAGSFGALWMTYGSLAPLLAGAALGAAFKSTLDKGAQFEYQLTFVKALGGESAAAVEKLSAAALDLGKNGLYGPIEVAKGLRILAQAGLNAEEQLKAIPSVLDLSTVGELGVDAAAETLAGVATAFGKSKDQFRDVGDIFAKAAAISQTSVAGLTESMKYASVVGEQYGVSLEDTATALTLLAKMNITGTSAGTAFRNMVKELYAPTNQAAAVMKQLGMNTKDSAGNLRPMADILYELKDTLQGYDQASQTNILQALFGERGGKEAVAMLSLTRDEWNKLRSDVEDSRGFMGSVAAELEATTSGTMKQAFNTLQASLVEVFNTSKYGMSEIALDLKQLFGSEEFKKTLAGLVETLGSAIRFVLDYKEALLGLAAVVVGGKLVAGVAALGSAMTAYATATTAATVAAGASTTVLATLAGTVGPMLLPVTLLAGAFTGLYFALREGTADVPNVSAGFDRISSALDRQLSKVNANIQALEERNRLLKEPAQTASEDKDKLRQTLAVEDAKVKALEARLAKEVVPTPAWENGTFYSKQGEAILKELSEARKSRQKAVETYNSVVQAGLREGELADYNKWATETARSTKASEDLVVKLRETALKSKGTRKAELSALADGIIKAGVDSDVLTREALVKKAKDALEVGTKTFTMPDDKGSKRGAAALMKSQVTDIETQVRDLLDTYKRAEEGFKTQAKEYVLAYPDAIAKSLNDLEATKTRADALFVQAEKVAGKDPGAKARVNSAQQRFNSEYLKEKQSLNQELLAADRKYVDESERALVSLGAKTLGAQEVFRRKFLAENGNLLKEVWARMDSADPEVAAAAARINEQLMQAFDLGTVEAQVTANLKTMSAQIESYRAQLSTVMKADQDGGLLAAFFGTSEEISRIKAQLIDSLQSSLSEVEGLIRNWNGDPEKKLQLLAERDKLKAQLDEASQVISPSIKDLSDTLGNGIANSITNGFKAGENPGRTFARNIGDAIKKSITKAIADSLSKQIALNLTGMLSKQGGEASSVISAGSDLLGIGTLASKLGLGSSIAGISSLSSTFSGGFAASVGGAGWTALEGAATMVSEATSMMGALQGVAQGLGAAAPYLAAGLLVAQQLGVFAGPTYHKGGAYIADTTGATQKADDKNLWKFNLTWGAYTSDRNQAYDDAMLSISKGLAKQIDESIKLYGGKAGTLSVGSRFASDNSDWSEGAIRVFDETGKQIYELSKRYTSDANEALKQFGEDSTRALLATLQNTDLTDEFDKLFAGIDPLKATLSEINAVLEQAAAIAQTINTINSGIDNAFLTDSQRLGKAFEVIGQAVPSTVGAYEALVRAQDLNTAAGRELAVSLVNNYDLWKQVQDATEASTKAIADQRYGLETQLLNAQGKTVELRNRELAALDASNRAIQQQIWMLEDWSKTYSDGQTAISTAQNNLTSAYSKQKSVLNDTVTSMQAFSKSIKTFRDGLLVGSLSTLNPSAKYMEAKSQFETTALLAQQGNKDAMDALQGKASTFLEASRAMYASGVEYNIDFQDVLKVLEGTARISDEAANTAQQQLDALNSSVSKLIDISDGVNSVQEAIDKLTQAVLSATLGKNTDASTNSISSIYQDILNRAPDQAGLDYWKNQAADGLTNNDIQNSIANSSEAQIQRLYQSLLGRSADQAGLSYWMQAVGSGVTLSQVEEFIKSSSEYKKVRGFASGGYHPGGLRVVGEIGPELEATGPARYWSFDQTKRMLSSGQNNTAALEAKLDAMSEELRMLRAQQANEHAEAVSANYDANMRNAQLIAQYQDDAARRARTAERYS